MNSVVLVGDSIRLGYQPLVAEKLRHEFAVLGSEQNAYTSRDVLANLERWAMHPNADIIHINCGLHDLALMEDHTARVAIEEYGRNVRGILVRLKEETSAHVVWATITPVIDEWHRRNKAFERRLQDVLQYNAVSVSVATDLGVEIDDLHAVIESAGREKCLMPDGVHMNELGNELLSSTVAGCIRLQR